MRVMVTGSNGQLGRDLTKVIGEAHEIFALGKEQLNVSVAEEVMIKVKEILPQIIIHAAAYTRVDEAEKEPDTAFRINAIGTRNVAMAAAVCGAKLVYISTDYVFDGNKGRSYCESDCPNPINVYGKSKYAGELYAQSCLDQIFIVRTSWLYGNRGNNFVRRIVSAARQHQTIDVVKDEVGSPTYTVDLSLFISQLIKTSQYGLYHATNQGSCSRYEFAVAILQEVGLSEVRIKPITSDQYRLAAIRPKDSTLDHEAIRLNGLMDLPSWRNALKRYMQSEFI